MKHKIEIVKHMLGFEIYGGIKAIKIELYGGDSAGNYFPFISILKFIKTIFKLQENFRKKNGNDQTWQNGSDPFDPQL